MSFSTVSAASASPTSRRSTIAGPSTSSSRPPGHFSRLDDDVNSMRYSSFPSTHSPPPPTAYTATSVAPSLAPSMAPSMAPSTAPPRPFPFTRDDTERSRLAYETLAASAKAYRVAMNQLSTAASNFGAALEACARLKEARAQPYPPGPYGAVSGGGSGANSSLSGDATADHTGSNYSFYGGGGNDTNSSELSCTSDVLMATSGLYYLAANQQGILAETVYRSFELPMVHELDRYRADVEAEQESYAASMREAGREIRRLEKDGVKLRKPRQRDVGRMRSHLVAMTAALDALTAGQNAHAITLLDHSRDMSATVSQAARNLVRAEMDIYDGLARKGWPGGGLDVVLDGAVDLFSGADDVHSIDDPIIGFGPIATANSDLGLGLGPKLLLLGGGGFSDSTHGKNAHNDGDDPFLDRGDERHDDDYDDVADTATISEHRGRPHSRRNSTTGTATARVASEDAVPDGDDTSEEHGGQEEGDSLLLQEVDNSAKRQGRSGSLAFESVQYHGYQSLDSITSEQYASAAAAASAPESEAKLRKHSLGKARPFSPQRMAVGPQEDGFIGTASEPAAAATGASEKSSVDTIITGAPVDASPGAAADTQSNGHGAAASEPEDAEQEDGDEGVKVWRQGI